jgi:hypothetical protein
MCVASRVSVGVSNTSIFPAEQRDFLGVIYKIEAVQLRMWNEMNQFKIVDC